MAPGSFSRHLRGIYWSLPSIILHYNAAHEMLFRLIRHTVAETRKYVIQLDIPYGSQSYSVLNMLPIISSISFCVQD